MKFNKQTIPIQKLPSGDILSIGVYKFYGKGTKKIYIQANIHGPELTGILVAKGLVDFIKKNGGNFLEFIIVPSCNPMGLNSQFIGQQTGYINHLSGKNWNRVYADISKNVVLQKKPTLTGFEKALCASIESKLNSAENIEAKLGLTLQKLAFKSDIIIDLHTAWGKAPHYVYCYKEQLELAKKFNIKNIIFLEENTFEGVFDEANGYPYFQHKGLLKKPYLPKQIFTVELGSDCNLDPENIQLGLSEITSYLSGQGILNTKHNLSKTSLSCCELKDFIYYHAPTGGLLIWTKKINEFFIKGEILGIIYEINSEKKVPVVAKHDGKMIIQFNIHAVHQGQQICKVMTNIKEGK